MQRCLVFVIALAASGCAERPQPLAYVAVPAPPRHDALFTPERVEPGRLEYAGDRDTFAPVLAQKFTYPTQQQANNAWQRAQYLDGGIHIIRGVDAGTINPQDAAAVGIAVFACKPGALNEQTARVQRFAGPVEHCATDFIDEAGKPFGRETMNFYHVRGAWHLQQTSPPKTPVHWRNPETSPGDRWSWVPGRDRHQ